MGAVGGVDFVEVGGEVAFGDDAAGDEVFGEAGDGEVEFFGVGFESGDFEVFGAEAGGLELLGFFLKLDAFGGFGDVEALAEVSEEDVFEEAHGGWWFFVFVVRDLQLC